MPVANRVEGGKRPRSSMAPTIVYDANGRLFLLVGIPRGSAIINYVAKTLIGVLDWGLDVQAAIDLPNVGSRNGPTELEAGTTAEALAPSCGRLDTRRHVERTQPAACTPSCARATAGPAARIRGGKALRAVRCRRCAS